MTRLATPVRSILFVFKLIGHQECTTTMTYGRRPNRSAMNLMPMMLNIKAVVPHTAASASTVFEFEPKDL